MRPSRSATTRRSGMAVALSGVRDGLDEAGQRGIGVGIIGAPALDHQLPALRGTVVGLVDRPGVADEGKPLLLVAQVLELVAEHEPAITDRDHLDVVARAVR